MCLKLKIFSVALLITVVQAAPYRQRNHPAPSKNCSDSERDDSIALVDQAQKGKQNLRINVKDFVLIWAPSDVLLTAAALLDPQLLGGELFDSGDAENEDNKPQNASTTIDAGVTINSSQKLKRSKYRFPALAHGTTKTA